MPTGSYEGVADGEVGLGCSADGEGESTTSAVGGRAIACKLWICALILGVFTVAANAASAATADAD